MKEEWIQEFKGRNGSLSTDMNFLWKKGNIYIMDNHRAALWCWLQEINVENKINIYHIDAHYDTRSVKNSEWLNNLPDLAKIKFNDYLEIKAKDNGIGEFPAIVWDNYLSLFTHLCSDIVNDFFTSTHLVGEKPSEIEYEEVEPYHFSNYFRDYLTSDEETKQWIINVDLDYFFSRQPEDFSLMFSKSYMEEIFTSIKNTLASNKESVLTICLSPECCGGWENAENLCSMFTDILGFNFKLPSA